MKYIYAKYPKPCAKLRNIRNFIHPIKKSLFLNLQKSEELLYDEKE